MERWWVGPAAGAALLLASACDEGVLDPGLDEQTLIVSEAAPSDGNGTLDPTTTVLQYYVNYGIFDLDRLTISGYDSTHTILHDLEVQWVPATGEVRTVQHFWSPVGGGTSGATRCAANTANVCPAGAVFADAGTRTVSFYGIVLHDFLGMGASSTVTGNAVWEDGFSDGGDH